jgi:hypothetical protein
MRTPSRRCGLCRKAMGAESGDAHAKCVEAWLMSLPPEGRVYANEPDLGPRMARAA